MGGNTRRSYPRRVSARPWPRCWSHPHVRVLTPVRGTPADVGRTPHLDTVMSWNQIRRLAVPQAQDWPRIRIPAAAFVALVLTVCCHSSKARISLDNSDSGKSITAQVGDTIEITLQTIGPGQYATPSVSSGSIRFLGEFSAGLPNPGGPRQLFRFEAAAPGRAAITIRRTGEDPISPTPAFEVTVAVY